MKPSISEPVRDLRRVKIVESGEPLVDYLRLCSVLVESRPRFAYRRESSLRKSVAEKLCAAAHAMPKGYRLAVVEGWRAPAIQRRLYRTTWDRIQAQHPDWSELSVKRVANRFTAPMDDRVPPPHTTGAAVDVLLLNDAGDELDLWSPFDRWDRKSFPTAADGLSDEAQHHREILCRAMATEGLTNYPSEYWHWSYGDQGWAYRGGHAHAIYGPVEPDGWQIDPQDEGEGAFERLV